MTTEDLSWTPEPRSGPRPETVGPAPHSQVDQLPPSRAVSDGGRAMGRPAGDLAGLGAARSILA